MNWRATHMLTAKRDLAIVPNSMIAKAKVVNASSPSGIHGITLSVNLDSKALPAASAEILRHAVLNSRLILPAPAPLVMVKSISANSTEFEISFFVEELAHSSRAQNELFDCISRHLTAAGIALSSSQSQPLWTQQAVEQTKTAAERALDLVAIFADLTAEERKTLATTARHKQYDEGDALVEPGSVLRSLFVVGAGVVSLTAPEGDIEFLRLGPGDHFGEIGMLTGRPAEATLKALVAVTTYELGKEDLAPVLEARPEVSHALCRALARRQAAGQLIASPDIDQTVSARRVTAWFSDRLHRLFDLANAE
jgi:hypothetical protein